MATPQSPASSAAGRVHAEGIQPPDGPVMPPVLRFQKQTVVQYDPRTDPLLLSNPRAVVVAHGECLLLFLWPTSTHFRVVNPPTNLTSTTSPHPYDAFRESNLPPLVFQIEEDTARSAALKQIPVPFLVDQAGAPVTGANGEQLRYFSYLPRYISVDLPGFLIEFFLRLDPRCNPNDMRDRMVVAGRPGSNAFQMRASRFRKSVGAVTWGGTSEEASKTEILFLSGLRQEQFDANSCMLIDPAGGRFIKPQVNGLKVIGRVLTDLSPTHFLKPSQTAHVPSPRMANNIKTLHTLQVAAVKQGLGTSSYNWLALPLDLKPAFWSVRKGETKQPMGRPVTSVLHPIAQTSQAPATQASAQVLQRPTFPRNEILTPSINRRDKRKRGAEVEEEQKKKPNTLRPTMASNNSMESTSTRGFEDQRGTRLAKEQRFFNTSVHEAEAELSDSNKIFRDAVDSPPTGYDFRAYVERQVADFPNIDPYLHLVDFQREFGATE